MAIIKCKMCGGDLILVEDQSIAECEYCGSVQTVPAADNEKKLTLFARANRLRSACEFDKAAGIYESIVADFPEEAEAYWGLVLCKYGIEYVDDPGTGKKIPTCHRSSFESLMEDGDFEQALENADAVARRVYRGEAKQIEELRKGIIEVSAKEEPYDIFICYKETDPDGNRTLDSVLAQDIYDAMTDRGYRVFFARITLEDKLGQEYEPYIFAALNSAKIMLVVGTDYEYFNAVWVKNEWSRFLQLMAKDKSKHLIPCYKGIDAYDMPKEFARLQAQDLGKMGAIQDILRGVEKLLPRQQSNQTQHEAIAQPGSLAAAPLLERAFMFLEDGQWQEAATYCERVLDMEPKNARAYLGKLLAELQLPKLNALGNCRKEYIENAHYKKARKFASKELTDELDEYLRLVNEQKLDEEYNNAKKLFECADTISSYEIAASALDKLIPWRDSKDLSEKCHYKMDCLRKDQEYQTAIKLLGTDELDALKKAQRLLVMVGDWEDAKVLLEKCDEKICRLQTQEIYLTAKKKMQKRNYESIKEAIDSFSAIIPWEDSETLVKQCRALLEELETEAKYQAAIREAYTRGVVSALAPVQAYAVAISVLKNSVAELSRLNGWRDSELKMQEFENRIAELTEVSENYETVQSYKSAKAKMSKKTRESLTAAIQEFETIGYWKDSRKLVEHCHILLGEMEKDSKYESAISLANTKGDVSVLALVEMYDAAQKDLEEAIFILRSLEGWKDSEQRIEEFERRITALKSKKHERQEAVKKRIAEERRVAEERKQAEAYAKQQTQWRAAGLCQHCGGQLKGLFGKKCASCGKPKDY